MVHQLNKVTPAVLKHPGVWHKELELPMHVHRSRYTCGFTVLPNFLLQDRRLSYTARGLLADLLSRPDGWREDGRHMADSSPQGRLAVAKALRELTAAGYYRVVRVRQADGTFVSEAHVYDSPQTDPQVAPAAADPVSGGAEADHRGFNPVKDLGKEPTLPAPLQEAGQPRSGSPASTTREGGRDAVDTTTACQAEGPDDAAGTADAPARRAVETLLRVVGPEPRLRVGSVEALALAPQIAVWLERGCTERDLAQALLTGLPDRVHSATASCASCRPYRPRCPRPGLPSGS